MTADPRNILITGATSGIGRAAALHFARAGHRVFATGRNRRALDELGAEGAGDLSAHAVDVTDAASIAALRDEVFERTGGYGIDVLINNAGYGLAAPLTEVEPADLRHQFETNVFGQVAVTRAFAPAMRERGHGVVVNVGSTGGKVSFPFFGPYTATKHALEAISDSLRVELRPFGVRVVLIEPGPIETGFADATMATVDRYRDPDSPYAPTYARTDAARAWTDQLAGKPRDVVRTLERAITSRRPKPRYVVPLSSKILLMLSRVTPTRLLDALLARALGLTPKNMSAPRSEPAAGAAPPASGLSAQTEQSAPAEKEPRESPPRGERSRDDARAETVARASAH